MKLARLRQTSAFTVVELLALLAVIAVLVGLMLPAMARTTTQTTISQCAANIRQLISAAQLFASDNGDILPTAGGSGGGSWPWDINAINEYSMEQYGAHRPQFYDPGFPQQNIDQMWNYIVRYNSNGVPTGGTRSTGYAWSITGNLVASDDQNASISTQVITLVGNDPALTETIPALPGNLVKIQPSRRVLTCDTLISIYGQTDPIQYSSYQWTLNTAVGYPFWSTPYGPWRGSSSSHLNRAGLPSGANEGMLDGHVKWYPWSNNFIVHASGDCPPFWWLSDPAKL